MQVLFIIVVLFLVGFTLLLFVTTYVINHDDNLRYAVEKGVEEFKEEREEGNRLSRKTLEQRMTSEKVEDLVLDYVKQHLNYYVNHSGSETPYELFLQNYHAVIDMSSIKWPYLRKTDKRFLQRDDSFANLEDKFVTQFRNIDAMRVSGVFVHDQLMSILDKINSIAIEMKNLMMLDMDTEIESEEPEKSYDEIIEEMRESSNQQLATGEGDQEIAKLTHNIVTLNDLWKNVFSTGMIDEYREVEENLWALVDAYQKAMRGQGSLTVVTENFIKLHSIIESLNAIAKIRIERKNKLSEGLELDSLETVVKNTLAQETSGSA